MTVLYVGTGGCTGRVVMSLPVSVQKEHTLGCVSVAALACSVYVCERVRIRVCVCVCACTCVCVCLRIRIRMKYIAGTFLGYRRNGNMRVAPNPMGFNGAYLCLSVCSVLSDPNCEKCTQGDSKSNAHLWRFAAQRQFQCSTSGGDSPESRLIESAWWCNSGNVTHRAVIRCRSYLQLINLPPAIYLPLEIPRMKLRLRCYHRHLTA